MNNVIPILPCFDISVQTAFYQQLGFTIKGVYTSPNPYAVVEFEYIELHFYGTRKVMPADNSSMCFIVVEDVDALNLDFTQKIKQHTGRVPRTGIPRISKVRDLKDDRRFTLTDTGGNTFFIGTPVKVGNHNFFRTLHNEEWAKRFAALYDVVYSKEDAALAASMLPKYVEARSMPDDLDRAKYLLLELDIQQQLNQPIHDIELKTLLEAHKDVGNDWERIKKRYFTILHEVE
jgi:hypothetical protein